MRRDRRSSNCAAAASRRSTNCGAHSKPRPTDPKLTAIIAEISAPSIGLATAQELHDLLRAAVAAKKRVVAVLAGDNVTVRDYLIACGASEIVINPDTAMMMLGAAAGGFFLRNALGKLGVEAQTLQWKEYKGAAEMFNRDDDVARGARKSRRDRQRLEDHRRGESRGGAQDRRVERATNCWRRDSSARAPRAEAGSPIARAMSRTSAPRSIRTTRSSASSGSCAICVTSRYRRGAGRRRASRADSWPRSGSQRRTSDGRRIYQRRAHGERNPARR